jgi:DNA adenine methylase
MIRPLVKIQGGKYRLRKWLLSLFPPHKTYVEAFGGSGSLLLNKQPSEVECYNELEPGLFNLMTWAKDHPEKLISQLRPITYDKETYLRWRNSPTQPGTLQDAVKRVVVGRMSRCGYGGTFCWSKRLYQNQPAEPFCWNSFLDGVPKVCERLKNVKITCKDALDLVPTVNNEDDLLYLDPPYPLQTRQLKSAYHKELRDDDHAQLLEMVRALRCKVVLSSYENPLYEECLKGWHKCVRQVTRHTSYKNKAHVAEVAWCNFS